PPHRALHSFPTRRSSDLPVTLSVERIEDGEVSPYLTCELRVGDLLELRGPIGGYFTWDAARDGGPLFLVAGGSGVVPLMCMLRQDRKSTRLNSSHVSISY